MWLFIVVVLITQFIFIWRIIGLQCWFDFCHSSAWINHRCTYVSSLLNLPSFPSPLGCYSARLGFLSHTANFHGLSMEAFLFLWTPSSPYQFRLKVLDAEEGYRAFVQRQVGSSYFGESERRQKRRRVGSKALCAYLTSVVGKGWGAWWMGRTYWCLECVLERVNSETNTGTSGGTITLRGMIRRQDRCLGPGDMQLWRSQGISAGHI